MVKRSGLIFLGMGVLMAGTALAGGDPYAKDASKTAAAQSASAQTAAAQTPANSQNAPTAQPPRKEFKSSSTASSAEAASSQGMKTANIPAQRRDDSFEAIEDEELAIDTESLTDGDGLGSLQVQWQISEDGSNWLILPGAIQPSFTPRDSEVGKYLRVQISYVDGQGNAELMLSPASLPVRNVNDRPIGQPELIGEAKENDSLTVDVSRISDEDGLGNFALIWQRSSQRTKWENVPDQFDSTLQLDQTDVGFSYRAVVSYIDGFGTRETLVTEASEIVANIDNPLEGDVIVRGRAIEGAELTLSTSTLTDYDGIASILTVWERSTDGRTWDIVQGTEGQRSLSLPQPLVGSKIRARANVVDNFGVETVVVSQPTEAVRNINNKPAGKITIRRVGS